MAGSLPVWMGPGGQGWGLQWPFTADRSLSVKTKLRALAEECHTPWTGTEDTGKKLGGDGKSCGKDLDWEF